MACNWEAWLIGLAAFNTTRESAVTRYILQKSTINSFFSPVCRKHAIFSTSYFYHCHSLAKPEIHCFKKNVTYLFLWLHRQIKYSPILIIFGVIIAEKYLQQKYACPPTTPVYCPDTVPCKFFTIHLPVFPICFILFQKTSPLFIFFVITWSNVDRFLQKLVIV